MPMTPKKITLYVLTALAILTLLFSTASLVEDVPNDKIIVNQYPISGEIAVWAAPGLKTQLFGNTTEYDKGFQFWFGSENQGSARKIVFNDAGNGKILGSVRILPPRDEKSMKKIHAEFGTQGNLERELIAPTVTKVIFATGPLMSSYESYAAKKNDLINYIEDQLRNGIYKTNMVERTITDPITGEQKTIKKAELVPSDNVEDNGWVRQESPPFKSYNLDLAQLSVDDIEYDQKIINQIQTQQEAAMSVQTSIAEAKKAEQDALKEEAIGKQKIAKARAEQLVSKEKAVVNAEQRREVARLDKEAAAFTKQKLILEGEGEAAKKRLVFNADGALTQKLDALVAINEKYAQAIQNYKGDWVPKVNMASGEGGSAGPQNIMNLMQLLTAKTAKDLSLDLDVSKN